MGCFYVFSEPVIPVFLEDEVECLLRGLGRNEDIQALYVEHAKTALED